MSSQTKTTTETQITMTDRCCSGYDKAGYQRSTRCCVAITASMAAGAAILVIQALSLAGILSPTIAGWSTLGLGGFILLAQLGAGGRLGSRKIEVTRVFLIAAAAIVLGALGAQGILTAKQMGWAVIGSLAGISILGMCALQCTARYSNTNTKTSKYTKLTNQTSETN